MGIVTDHMEMWERPKTPDNSYESLDPLTTLLDWARDEPERAFISYINSSSKLCNISLKQTVARVAQIRDILLQEPFSKSSSIGLLYGNEPGVVPAFQGCWAAGKTAVFLNPSWTPKVATTLIARLGIEAILHESEVPPKHLLSACPVIVKITPETAPATFNDFKTNTIPETAFIWHTSGTTGIPKSCPIMTAHLRLDIPRGQFLEGKTGAVLTSPTSSLNCMVLFRAPFFKMSMYLPPPDPWTTFKVNRGDPALGPLYVADALRSGSHLLWGLPSMLLASFQVSKGETFPIIQHIILGGERTTRTMIREIHRYCPNADIVIWFGATEFAGCIASSPVYRKEDMAKGIFPDEPPLETFWGSHTPLLMDVEDISRPVPKVTGSRGLFAVIPKGTPRPLLLGASNEAISKMFGTYKGKQIVYFSDVAQYVGPNASGILPLGRVGRDIKILDIVDDQVGMHHINLDYYDNFIKDQGLLPGRTITLYPHNHLLTFLEASATFTNQEMDTYTKSVNLALKENKVPGQLNAIVHMSRFPIITGGKVDMQGLESIAAERFPKDS